MPSPAEEPESAKVRLSGELGLAAHVIVASPDLWVLQECFMRHPMWPRTSSPVTIKAVEQPVLRTCTSSLAGPRGLTRLVGRVQLTLHQWTPPTTQMCEQVLELCQSDNQSERTIPAQRSWLQTSPASPTPKCVLGQSCCVLDAMRLLCGTQNPVLLRILQFGSQHTSSHVDPSGGSSMTAS